MTHSTDPRLQSLRDAVMECRRAAERLNKLTRQFFPVGSWVRVYGTRKQIGQIHSYNYAEIECVYLAMKSGTMAARLVELEPCEPPAWAERKKGEA